MTHTAPARRSNRTTKVVETSDYVAFARRILRAMGKRVQGHADHLADLAELATEVDAQLVAAVAAAKLEGYSWADVARQLGCTRQAAQQRFGARIAQLELAAEVSA